MSVVDDFLKKMRVISDDEDEYDDYDDYDEYDEPDEETPAPKKQKKAKKARNLKPAEDEFEDDPDDLSDSSYYAPAKPAKSTRTNTGAARVVGMRGSDDSPEVCMISPKSFDDANTIADVLLSHKAVVLNLEGIDMSAAQRIIDFASGSCYTVGGNLQRISKKIFIVVPRDMNLSGDFDDLIGDMVDLNSVSMLK